MCVCGHVCTVQLKTLQATGVKNSVVVRVGVFNRAKEGTATMTRCVDKMFGYATFTILSNIHGFVI